MIVDSASEANKYPVCHTRTRFRRNMMQIDTPQVIKLGKRTRRKEWGLLDLEERDVKSRDSERVFCKSSGTDSPNHSRGTRQVREL